MMERRGVKGTARMPTHNQCHEALVRVDARNVRLAAVALDAIAEVLLDAKAERQTQL